MESCGTHPRACTSPSHPQLGLHRRDLAWTPGPPPTLPAPSLHFCRGGLTSPPTLRLRARSPRGTGSSSCPGAEIQGGPDVGPLGLRGAGGALLGCPGFCLQIVWGGCQGWLEANPQSRAQWPCLQWLHRALLLRSFLPHWVSTCLSSLLSPVPRPGVFPQIWLWLTPSLP